MRIAPTISQSNMCPLLKMVYRHSIKGYMAMSMCHHSKTALSQSCHAAVFANTRCADFHRLFLHPQLAHERESQAECLRRRHE